MSHEAAGQPSGRPVTRNDRPAGTKAPNSPGSASDAVTFPQIARLELDDLLEQLIERAQDVLNTQGRLRGLLLATRAISSDLSLPVLLQRIIESARDLVGARYGALGVLGSDQQLEEFITVGLDDETVAAIGPLPRGKGLLGQLITDPQALRLKHLDSHPQSVGFPPGHPPMNTFLGVPIRVGDKVFGNLYLTEKSNGGVFTAEDEELVEALASAAGVAIDNARLYEAERRRHRWLSASAELSRELLTGESNPLPLITSLARRVADADLASILVPVANAPDLLMTATADGAGADSLLGKVIRREQSPAGRALTEECDLLVAEPAEFPKLQAVTAESQGPALFIRLPEAAAGQAGVLALVRTKGARPFSRDEQAMLASFADQAGVALKLADAQAARRRLLLMEDRDRIARDLHDTVIQQLFAVGLGMTALAARSEDPHAQARLEEYTEQLDNTIRAIRQTIFKLQRTRELGLQAKVLDVADNETPALGFSPDLRFIGPLDTLVSTEIADHAAAVVREALSNAARHGHASGVEVVITATAGQQLVVTVTDDGVGMTTPTRDSGIANMRSRAEQLGGTCTITSPAAPHANGTRVEWSVPLPTA